MAAAAAAAAAVAVASWQRAEAAAAAKTAAAVAAAAAAAPGGGGARPAAPDLLKRSVPGAARSIFFLRVDGLGPSKPGPSPVTSGPGMSTPSISLHQERSVYAILRHTGANDIP